MGHILLADDHRFLLKALSILLSKEGFTFETANNGQEAIDLFELSQFDAVITDLNMPLKNGYDVIQHIRRDRLSQTPIIVFSSMIQDENLIQNLEEAGASLFLSKTDSPLGIVSALHSLVQKAS